MAPFPCPGLGRGLGGGDSWAGLRIAAAGASCDPAAMRQTPLHPVEDGPGAGRVVEVTVRVMVGPERSTVLVRRGRDPVAVHGVREHGHEADGLGAAVEAAVRAGLAGLR